MKPVPETGIALVKGGASRHTDTASEPRRSLGPSIACAKTRTRTSSRNRRLLFGRGREGHRSVPAPPHFRASGCAVGNPDRESHRACLRLVRGGRGCGERRVGAADGFVRKAGLPPDDSLFLAA